MKFNLTLSLRRPSPLLLLILLLDKELGWYDGVLHVSLFIFVSAPAAIKTHHDHQPASQPNQEQVQFQRSFIYYIALLRVVSSRKSSSPPSSSSSPVQKTISKDFRSCLFQCWVSLPQDDMGQRQRQASSNRIYFCLHFTLCYLKKQNTYPWTGFQTLLVSQLR